MSEDSSFKMDLTKLEATLRLYDQSHLMRHWDQLNPADKVALYKDLSSINYDEMDMVTVFSSFIFGFNILYQMFGYFLKGLVRYSDHR